MTGGTGAGQRPDPPLYITGGHSCSYFPDLTARTVFVDPLAPMDGETYEQLLQQGFRRSGAYVYRPACGSCQRCVAVRVPVEDYAPNRSQRRNRRRNEGEMEVCEHPAGFDAEHYALFRTYIRSRHADGSMAGASPASYEDFLVAPWGGATRLIELRLDGRLVAVAVTDLLPCSLSAVYTFFDPEHADRAPGTYSVLCQIDAARRRGLDYLYLGYWIGQCRKMSYKDHFRPLEAWMGDSWRRHPKGEPIIIGTD